MGESQKAPIVFSPRERIFAPRIHIVLSREARSRRRARETQTSPYHADNCPPRMGVTRHLFSSLHERIASQKNTGNWRAKIHE